MRRILSLALSIWAFVFWPSPSWSASLFDPRYDLTFRVYSQQYLPENDWELLKAQCYQESLLEPDAVSPVGAQGLCQFMPRTWDDVAGALRLDGSPFNPYLAIRAAAYYMRGLKRFWRSPRPDEPDRNNLALASYNAGAGNLVRAQKKCGGALLYHPIVKCLPQVTGYHSRETKTYVERTRRWYAQLRRQR